MLGEVKAISQSNIQVFYLFIYLFIYSNLFLYIPFKYVLWEWKESHSLYILRHLQSDTTNSRLERVYKNQSYNLHNLTLCTDY
jgi:hypothetical protein